MAEERSGDQALEALAREAGISVEWQDAFGQDHRVAADVIRQILAALDLPANSASQITESRKRLKSEAAGADIPPLITGEVGKATPLPPALTRQGPRAQVQMEDGRQIDLTVAEECLPPIPVPGYHHLAVGGVETTLAIAPQRCFNLADANGDGEKLWGAAVQLYSLRRAGEGAAGDGGIGDFTSLARLCEAAGQLGASAVAISPIHAMFMAQPERISPYSPSSRLLLNPLHADPAALFGEEQVNTMIAELDLGEARAAWEARDLIDWPAAARGKLRLFRAIFESFQEQERPERAAFEAFRDQAGVALRDHACFEALHAHFLTQSPAMGSWRDWPEDFRDPASLAVARFAEEHAQEIAFHAFLQWQAAQGLARAQEAARGAGMSVGLIADLAVGADGGGSQAWSRQDENLIGLSIGAPPDLYNPLGQSWGLNAFSPRALRRLGFRSFIAMLRANLAQAGGIRIDHIMGLMRLWLLPEGASPTEGVYLSYPLKDLLRLVALESWRHRAIVIGEDLGTVPPGFRETMAERSILGMSVLWFETSDRGDFAPPGAWRGNSAAMTSTHDLPTLAGWWRERDLEVRRSLDLFPSEEVARNTYAERKRQRDGLWKAVRMEEARLPEEAPIEDCLAFVGRSASHLAIVPLEDLLGLVEQPNLPGTIDEHPNWRHRLPRQVGDLLSVPPVPQRIEALRKARTGNQTREPQL